MVLEMVVVRVVWGVEWVIKSTYKNLFNKDSFGGRGAAASRGQGHAGRARGGSAVGPRGGGRAAGQRRYGGMCIGEKKEPRSGKEKAAARE